MTNPDNVGGLPDGLLEAAKLLESNGYTVCRATPAGGDVERDANHERLYALNSAPAGSGEVVVPAIERMLVDAYAAGMNGDNFDMLAARRNLSALLRKLQQGAE